MDTYITSINDINKEINEAIRACDITLGHLRQADSYLDSAGNWGILDLFGGGMLSTLAKHSKMDDAQRELQRAKDSVKSLRKELSDVGELSEVDINVDSFLTFADFFFDGLVADWLVQSKIRNAQEQINQAIGQISAIKAQLRASLR